MTAKITGIKVTDFKRVKLVEIQPSKNGLTIIGGNNRQGKTSVLDAIAYGLGGEAFRPTDVDNAESGENATIRVEVDGMIVERFGKNAALKVTDARGLKGNQTLLNEIISKFALNLGGFIKASDLEKSKMLLKMFPELEKSLDELNAKANAIRERRTDINRDVKRFVAQKAGMALIADLPEKEIDIVELSAKLDKALQEESAFSGMERELAETERELSSTEHNGVLLRERKADAEKELETFEAEVIRRRAELKTAIEKHELGLQESRNKWTTTTATKQNIELKIEAKRKEIEGVADEIRAEVAEVGDKNAKIRENIKYKKLAEEIKEMETSSGKLTAELDSIDATRKEMLSNASLPLPELSINETGELLYSGKKWDCWSGAEQLKVSSAICMYANPKCGFVLIDGLETMDATTLAEFGAYLAERNMQGIGTIVGDTAATVIIEDGMVKEVAK